MKPLLPICCALALLLLRLAAQPVLPPVSVAPMIELRMNGRSAAASLTLTRGEPILVVVTLRHPAQLGDETVRSAGVRFAPSKGTWTDALVLAVTDVGGTVQPPWAFQLIGEPGMELNLSFDQLSTVVYRLSGAATAGLNIGSYRLTARLSADGRPGFEGTAESAPVAFTLTEAPADITGAALAERQRWRVEDAILAASGLRGQAAAAELNRADAAANTLFRAQPEEPMSWVLLARVQEASGDPRLAALFAQSALGAWRKKNPDAPELPLDLLELERRLAIAAAAAPPRGAPANRGSSSPDSIAVTPAAPPAHTPTPIHPASPDDAEFSRDPRGQWATGAEASSEYGPKNYSAQQATGAPNVTSYGDHAEAWASKTPDGREEWLKLTFATPVSATAVRVRQTYNPGAISKIEAFAADGRAAVVWSGRDTTVYARNQIAWFTTTFEPPPFPVQTIKLTLDSVAVKGWNEIDAVQLVGEK